MADLTGVSWEKFPLRADPNDRISKNFSLYELTRSETAERLLINNRFERVAEARAAVYLCRKVLQPIRDKFGRFTPNSVFRCQELERAFKKKRSDWVSTSQHTLGQACDIEIPEVSKASCKFNRVIYLVFMIAVLTLSLTAPSTSFALGACAKVKLEILQELTLERIAFDAKMVITNNVPDKDLTNVRVDVSIVDDAGNSQNAVFYVRVSSVQNIAAVDGTGTVKAATTSEIHWLIMPSPGAGGSVSTGRIYWVGATLTYTVVCKQETVTVTPDRIIVKPEPQLVLDYFTPYDVLGDNPFTPLVEAPIPCPLAVRVLNAGYGSAVNLMIDSAQPKIVENNQGLLVDFKLLGSAVNDSAVSPSLTVPIGTRKRMFNKDKKCKSAILGPL